MRAVGLGVFAFAFGAFIELAFFRAIFADIIVALFVAVGAIAFCAAMLEFRFGIDDSAVAESAFEIGGQLTFAAAAFVHRFCVAIFADPIV